MYLATVYHTKPDGSQVIITNVPTHSTVNALGQRQEAYAMAVALRLEQLRQAECPAGSSITIEYSDEPAVVQAAMTQLKSLKANGQVLQFTTDRSHFADKK
jgi:hypothetical protein